MNKPLPYLDPEDVFNDAISQIGGMRVDALVGENPGFENADYYFESDVIIAELKELQADPNSDAKLRKRIEKLIAKFVREGRMEPLPPGKRIINTNDIPENCQLEYFNPFKRKLEGPIKKANRQIKETKTQFNMPNALGLLILVNESNTLFDPSVTAYFLHHILKQLHSIDTVIYCSINLLMQMHDISGFEKTLPWISFLVEGRRCLPEAFNYKLEKAVHTIMNKKRGFVIPSISGKTSQIDVDSVNIKKENPSQNEYFVQPRKFYRGHKTGYKYYCKSVENGLADLYLVESYQNGKLIQALFSQKLIYATLDVYDEITDAKEIQRLKTMLNKIK